MYRSFLLLSIFSLCIVTLASGQENAAIFGRAYQSSLFERGFAENAIDGNTDGNWGNGSVTHTQDEQDSWWEVDLGGSFDIDSIVLFNRTDCCADRLRRFHVFVSEDPIAPDADPDELETTLWNVYTRNFFEGSMSFEVNQRGRYVRVQQNDRRTLVLSLAETQVFIAESTKEFQRIDIPEIPKQRSDASVTLPASSSAGLPISYTIVDGPGAINNDNELSFTGGGMVTIEGSQAGNDDFYAAAPKTQTIEVVDPALVAPLITRHNFSESYDFAMNSLTPINIWASFGIEHPELFWVSERKIIIDGVDRTVDMLLGEGTRAVWTPDSYGAHTIEVWARSDHGTETSQSYTVNVSEADETVSVVAMDKAEVVWPRAPYNAYSTATLPSFKGQYNKITASLDITCPDEGCDPFDRIGRFFVKSPEGQWIEIFRYITPFGIECSHEVDLTDMAPLLQGKTEFRFFVETFSNGWQATLRLEYEPGQPEYDYSRVVPVWDAYFPFGDFANLQPIPNVNYTRAANAERSHMRMYTSGHGWGENNSNNAAEFFRTTHHIMVNDAQAYTQNLWYDCDPNPDGCNNQLGTWRFDRAGWCPGAVGQKYTYDLNPWADSEMKLHYRFARGYRDFCHPNAPNCQSGFTCTNCNDGFNPFYVVSAYIIEEGDAIIEGGQLTSTTSLERIKPLSVAPNPSLGVFNMHVPNDENILSGTITNAQGRQLNTVTLNDGPVQILDLTDFPAGVYFINLIGESNLYSSRLVKM